MRQRVVYIDRLKGLAIFAVVMGHLTIHPLEMEQDVIRNFVGSFHVPLLFFLSGMVISTPPHLGKLVHKVISFIMPFLTVGLAFTYIIGENVDVFFTQGFKLGYWYLLVLAEFYVLLVVFALNKKNGTDRVVCDVGIACIIWLLLFVGNHVFRIGNLISLQQCFDYWPLFIAGFILRRNSLVECVFRRNWLYTVAVVVFVLLYALYASGVLFFLRFIFPFSVFAICYLFRLRKDKSSFIENQLEKIGRRSLDVYIYQYVVIWTGLISLKPLGAWFSETGNVLLELALTFIISVVVCCLCVFIGYAIRQSKVLGGIVYGSLINGWLNRK